jgi:aspartyl protease family protein
MDRRPAIALLLVLCGIGAGAQQVTFNGRMGDKAVLVIDGQVRTLSIGTVALGVKLLAVNADEARVEVDGKPMLLRQGSPAHVGAAPGVVGREIVIPAGSGGHFITSGSINGRVVQFMVDTGATTVAMSQADADRIGLDYRNGQRVVGSTANGIVPAHVVNLSRVRIGEVEVYDVPAVVLPMSMEHVLLGNSFLMRFQMKRDNDTMTLVKR